MSDLIQTNFQLPKWDAKKISGVVIAALLVGGAVYGFSVYVLPMILTIALNWVKFGILGIVGVFMLMTVMNPKFWRGLRYMSEALSQWTLGLAIEMNPWAILNLQIDEAEKDRQKLSDSASKLKGNAANLNIQLEDYTKIMLNSKAEMEVGQKRYAQQPDNDELALAIEEASNNFTNAKDFVESVTPICNDINKLVTFADKAYVKSGYALKNAKTTLKMQKAKYEAVTSGAATMSAAMKAFAGNTDLNNDSDKALDFLRKDIAMKIGGIKNSISITSQFMNTQDLKDAGKVKMAMDAMKQLDVDKTFNITASTTASAIKLPASTGSNSGNNYLDILK